MPRVMPLRPDDRRHVARYRLTGRFDDLAAGDDQPRIFLAKRTDGQTVVVSLLAENPAADAAARDRFTAEARAARRVPPFCTVRILDGGFDGAGPYLVAEYVPGPSLAEVISAEGALPPDILWALAVGTATGLTAIHQSGLVHGTLGPEKVLLTSDGPRIFGFSITPPYGRATPAADMLAWAQILLAAATGRAPVGPEDLAFIPAGLRPMVSACLSPNPAGRPGARAVLAELLSGQDLSSGLLAAGSRAAQSARHAPISTSTPRPRQPAPRPRQPAQRRRRSPAAIWIAVGVICLAALVAAGVMVSGSRGGRGHGAKASARTSKPGPTPARIPAPFAATWSGTVHQTNPVLSTTVHILLTAGSATGTVAYPDLGCSGTLTLTSASQSTLTLAQKIVVGKCANGVITLETTSVSRVKFSFLRPGGQNPEGILTRQR